MAITKKKKKPTTSEAFKAGYMIATQKWCDDIKKNDEEMGYDYYRWKNSLVNCGIPYNK